MKTKIIEVTNENFNWGKFMLLRPDTEWERRTALPGVAPSSSLLAEVGWTGRHIWVLDLQTGEGACFEPRGLAKADLDKHRIWVCPMFEPFLARLYQMDLSDLDALPDVIELTQAEAPPAFGGYRRPGPQG